MAGEVENVSIRWRHHGYVIKKHFPIVLDISLLPLLSMRLMLMANGRFPYLFVMISRQVITLMSTLLCFCFCCVLIKAIFAPDFATVLLASKNLCCRLSETFSYCVSGMVINAVQTIATMDKCEMCSRKLQSHSYQIQCCVCSNHYHMKCVTPSPEDFLKLTNERNEWHCPTCLSNIFPYDSIGDEKWFYSNDNRHFLLIR